MTISEKINNHIYAYEGAGYPIPPYRLTCAEHKILLKEVEPLMRLSSIMKEVNFTPTNHKVGRIARYLDVEIEVVQIVEDYI